MYDDGCTGDCLAYNIKLNCQDRMRRAAERAIGSPRFGSRMSTRVSFERRQNTEAGFAWMSSFTVPDSPFPSRRFSFLCTGEGRSGAGITGWRITDLELLD